MSNEPKGTVSTLVEAVNDVRERPSPLYQFVRAAMFIVPVLGAMPTAWTLYQSYSTGIPYSQVSHRLAQYDLWVKNGGCRIDYREITAAKGTKISVGACPDTGDVSIKVAQATGQPRIEWIPFNQITKPLALLDWAIGVAHAEGRPVTQQADGRIVVAQAEAKVVCQGWEGRTKIVRIVNEGAKCVRETILPIQGKVEKREDVPCNTACPGDQPKKT
jgi:hypothetical protein